MQINDWLGTKVQDVMTTDVLTLAATDTMRAAVDLFVFRQISGAPVVDEVGKCVGVLSTRDITEAEGDVVREQTELANEFYKHSNLVLPVSIYEQELAAVQDRLEPALSQAVRNFMTTDVVTIGRFDPLSRAVRYMVDAQIHRIIVTNSHGVVCGLLSTTDIMAALLRGAAAEKQQAAVSMVD